MHVHEKIRTLKMKNGDETIRFKPIVFQKTMQTVPKRFSVLFLIFLFLCAAVLPACAGEEQRAILISDDYQIMRDGDVLKFQQGYEISLKGFGSDTVLVEFRNNYSNNISMGSVVLKEGETVQCYRGSGDNKTEILMLTLDKLYLNNSQVIVGFSHIYQFEDTDTRYTEETAWTFETAVLDNPSIPQKPNNPGKSNNIGPDVVSEPLYIILVIGLAAVALILISIIFRKRVEKKKRVQRKTSKEKNEN